MRRVWAIGIALCVMLLICGCGNAHYKNKKADDELSKLVYERLGEDVFYISKEDSQGIKSYEFYLKKEDKEILKNFFSTVDTMLGKNREKITIHLACYIPGGLEFPVSLTNYVDNDLDEAESKEIVIQYPFYSRYELFLEPDIYTVIEDVRVLYIEKDMQDLADEKGIDWYQVWPTLEEMWIRDGEELYKVEDKK